MNAISFGELSEGMQVTVDGVSAVVRRYEGIFGASLAFFAPGSARPMNVFGRSVVGQWKDAWLHGEEWKEWTRGKTALLMIHTIAIGGNPPDNGRVWEKSQKPRYAERSMIKTYDACIGKRVFSNPDKATWIDWDAWVNAFVEEYSL